MATALFLKYPWHPARPEPHESLVSVGTQIAVERRVKKLALLTSGCLFLFACSSDGGSGGNAGQGGHAGGRGGGGGSSGGAGITGGGGHAAGTGGNTGSGGQTGGNGGSGGITGGGGEGGGKSGGKSGGGGSAGRGGASGQGGAGQGGKAGQGAAGKGGQGGAGQGGKAGQGGAGGAPTCRELEAAYVKAMKQAKACLTGSAQPQCTQLMNNPLLCCPTFVNDRTEPDKIYAQHQAAGCTSLIVCAAVICPVPIGGACVPINSGDWCTDVLTP